MRPKKFLFLENSYMSIYTLRDIESMDNVRIIHRKMISKNAFVNLMFNIHNSAKIARYINLPFKCLWNKFLFGKLLSDFHPDYVILTNSWYSNQLLGYFRKNGTGCKLLLRFSDKVSNTFGTDSASEIQIAKNRFDGVIVYSQEDALKYNCAYHSVGYSKINMDYIKPCKKYDVVFIGAEKGRMNKIRNAYIKFKEAGLSCFFYVIMVDQVDRKDDGIIYADEVMPFIDYLSYELAAKCLFEIVQEGTSGRTYRMMESIIYNKLLITNCKEIKETPYYNGNYVQLYSNVSEIDPLFVRQQANNVDYKYKGEFSPECFMNFIEENWK